MVSMENKYLENKDCPQSFNLAGESSYEPISILFFRIIFF